MIDFQNWGQGKTGPLKLLSKNHRASALAT